MQELKPIKEGKVREIYDNGDTLIMVATDRISCFDVILKNQVTKKGAVLTQMSKFWFDMTRDILPNHMISVDVKDMPEFFRQERFDGNSMMCRKLEMLPVECIVRGRFLTQTQILTKTLLQYGEDKGHTEPVCERPQRNHLLQLRVECSQMPFYGGTGKRATVYICSGIAFIHQLGLNAGYNVA